ncbi:MAG: hypothetical protein L3J91_04905, partial [Thermoplasmata archaeon]|nr:hypothetical protein [Thermoplasmata archaeon]
MADGVSAAALPVVVGLPEALGRRMRLGPFPSARHALKFSAYAAAGGTAAALLGAVWSVPFLGMGFLLAVYRSDGRSLDERVGGFLGFCWRARPKSPAAPAPRVDPPPSGPYLTEVDGQLLALVAVRGIPIAFLPPADARAVFEAHRDLLRGLDHGLVVVMGTEPVTERPFLPARRGPGAGTPSDRARQGYTEMVGLLCRRRYRRRVLVALWEPVGAGAPIRLERSVEHLVAGLGRLDLTATRLRDGPLRAAAAQIGWRE